MVIQYQIRNNSLKIFSEAKVISSDFRKWFLLQLVEKFNLYENLNGKIKLLDAEIIEKSAVINSLEIEELKKCYDENKIKEVGFEEFLDAEKIVFANIYMFDKDIKINEKNIKKNKSYFAIIDLEPDGNVNSIWIENPKEKELLIKLIDKYNLEQ